MIFLSTDPILCFVLFLSSFCCLSSGSPIPKNSPSLIQPTSNHSLPNTPSSSPWDSRFSIRAGYTDIRLPATLVLMNSVKIAAYLALLDFEEQADLHILPQTNLPDVQIEMEPVPPADSVPAKILVWGLYGAINDIVGRKQFKEVEFDLLWSEKVVAWLRFKKAESGAFARAVDFPENGRMGQGHIENSTTSTNVLGSLTTLTAGAIPPFEFVAQYTPYAKPLSIFQVFMSIFSALVQVAHFPSNAIVKPKTYESVDYNSQIAIVRADSLFKYRDFVEGLRQIPDFMLKNGKFQELGWKIEVDGREAGSGFCEWIEWRGARSL